MTTLKLFPAFNGYVGKLHLNSSDREILSVCAPVETIVILDVSGSMGSNVQKIIREVLPKTFYHMGYKPTDKITLIVFHDFATTYHTPIENLLKSPIICGNMTFMAKGIQHLKYYLTTTQSKHIRLLTISDGALSDQEATVHESGLLAGELRNYNINSQAIRLFTSESQPDTRGLSSVMQLNTVTQCKLVDVRTYVDIEKIIGDLFKNDNLNKHIILSSDKEIFLNAPWLPPTKQISINNTDNVIWFKDIPKNISINDKNHELRIEIDTKLTFDNFDLVMKEKIDYYMNRLKVLKIVNTPAAIHEISDIVGYFGSLEKTFHENELIKQDGILTDTSLRARTEYYKNLILKKTKSVSLKMSQIANDEKVAKLNSAQQAEYLRTVDVSKNSKALARRALNNDIDFDSVVKKEVLDMYQHLDELTDIDDSNHCQSFYSKETTLGGIRATCDLVKKGILDDMTANDILTMINIVGVPCYSVIGNYPDPMTWRVDNIYVSCYLSLSDILIAHIISGGKLLKAVGTDNEINNVIPVFENDKVHMFMKKYGPSILEYSASIGMRRMIMNVPMTYSYTICAGVWKMVQELNKSKSDINVNIFNKLTHTYSVAIGNYFDHVLPHMVDQDEKLSYYMGNNGVTNMISVMLKLYKTKNVKNIGRITRALYTYEINQAVKRKYKYLEHGDIVMAKDLNELVGINFDKHKTPLKDLLEEEENPLFYDNYDIKKEIFEDIMQSCWYVNYLTLLPEFLSLTINPNPKSTEIMKKIPPMDDKTVSKALGIDYDLKLYQFFTIVQSMLYNNKADRVDSDNSKMLISDLVNFEVGDLLVKNYVKKQYQNKYNSELSYKMKAESELLCDMLVSSMIECSLEKYIDYFKNGITRGTRSHKIINKSSLGYQNLKNYLLNLEIDVSDRISKLKILLLGRDECHEIVWNNGNTLAVDLREFKDVFVRLDDSDSWTMLHSEYTKRFIHIYRTNPDGKDIPNRNSHCNGKPSYWALGGYNSIYEYYKNVTREVWEEYKNIHHDCCGVSRLNF